MPVSLREECPLNWVLPVVMAVETPISDSTYYNNVVSMHFNHLVGLLSERGVALPRRLKTDNCVPRLVSRQVSVLKHYIHSTPTHRQTWFWLDFFFSV